MSGIEGLLTGLAVAFTLQNLLFALVGTVVGTLIGVLPGIGPALTIALLLPLTYGLEPASAFIMFAGIYYGAMYGGSTTSILLKTPGESGSVITAIDGNKMARPAGVPPRSPRPRSARSSPARIATLLLAFFAPWMVGIAVQLGAQDYFALMVVAFLTVGALVGSSPLRGSDLPGPRSRHRTRRHRLPEWSAAADFGQVSLLDGVDTVILIVALFAVGEVL